MNDTLPVSIKEKIIAGLVALIGLGGAAGGARLHDRIAKLEGATVAVAAGCDCGAKCGCAAKCVCPKPAK